MRVVAKYNGPTDMFWATQPETHLPWLGVSGFVLAPRHLLATLEMVSGSCIVTPSLLIWPFEIVWAIAPLWCLLKVPYERKHHWYRVGLVVGVATWLSPTVNAVFFR